MCSSVYCIANLSHREFLVSHNGLCILWIYLVNSPIITKETVLADFKQDISCVLILRLTPINTNPPMLALVLSASSSRDPDDGLDFFFTFWRTAIATSGKFLRAGSPTTQFFASYLPSRHFHCLDGTRPSLYLFFKMPSASLLTTLILLPPTIVNFWSDRCSMIPRPLAIILYSMAACFDCVSHKRRVYLMI